MIPLTLPPASGADLATQGAGATPPEHPAGPGPDPLQRLWRRAQRQQRFCLLEDEREPAWTVDRLEAALARLARQWQTAGVQPGQVLLLRAAQGLPAFLSFWAAQRLGLVWLASDPAWPVARLATVAEAAGADWLIDAGSEPLPPAELPEALARLPRLGARPAEGHDAAPAPPTAEPAWSGRAVAALLPTSGSTGGPKLVALSRAALARSALLAVRSFGWQAGERLLNLAEPHTMSGLRNGLLAAPLAGMAWLVSPPATRADVFALLGQIHTRRPQRVVAAPLLVRQANLWRQRLPADTWTGVRALYCTGADLDPVEVQRFHAAEGLPVLNYYGLTETVGLCLSQALAGWDPQDRSLGRPVGCRIRLVDATGATLPEDAVEAVGELQVHQRHPSAGYWRGPAGPFDAQGWLATGDLARRDAQGRVHLVGRLAHFIKTAGTEKVAPAEVEQALETHADVLEAAVCGLPAGVGIERIAALVVLRPATAHEAEGTALQAALIAHVARLLGSARAPSRIRFVPSLPRGAHGKLLRPQLPSMFTA